jgi:hypothetical protein
MQGRVRLGERGYANDMNLRRRKSKQQQAADLLASYVKLKAVSKTAKGAKKAAKGTAAYQVAKRTPLAKRIPIMVGAVAAAGAAAFAAVKLTGGGEDESAPAGA